MKSTLKKLVFIAALFSVCGFVRGEIADAVYRDGVIAIVNWHAGLVLKYDHGTDTRWVIHSPGNDQYGNSVRISPWSDFLDGHTWMEPRVCPANLSGGMRQLAIDHAIDQLNAYYWTWGWMAVYCANPLGYWMDNTWKRHNTSPQNGDGSFRCDGLVEWVYEQIGYDPCNDAMLYNDAGLGCPVNLFLCGPYYQYWQIPTAVQTPPTGVGMTYPTSTDYQNPTTTCSVNITLGATASDAQSGLSFNQPFDYWGSVWTGSAWSSWSLLGKSGSTLPYTVTRGVYYSFYVTAYDNDGNPADSSVYYFYANPLPSTPTGVSASDGTYCGYVQVTWNAASSATGYYVYRDGGYIGSTSNTYYNDTPGNSSSHSYTVQAYNSCGTSSSSGSDSGYANATPSAPTGVSASDGTYCGYVHVTWNSASRTTGYYVYRDGGYIGSTSNTYYDDTPGNTSSHSYTVQAYNSCGTSGSSSADTGYANATPSAPTGVSASDGTYSDKVRITWNASSGATSYEVWRNTSNNSGSAAHVSSPDPTGTTYDDTSAVAGTTYYFWVKAKNSCGTSGFGGPDTGYASISCTTLSTPSPTAPSCGATVSSTTPTLSWTDVANESGYVVQIFNGNNCSGSPIHTSPQLPPNTTSYSVPGGVLTTGQTYSWRVQAKGNGSTYCDSPWSSCCSFSIPGVCIYTLSATSTNLAAAGGSGSFMVYANSGCNWSAVANDGWLHTSSTGSGTNTVAYTVDANADTSSRSGTISVGGQTFTVNQAGTSPKKKVAIYCETGGLDFSKHTDEFETVVNIPCYAGSEFDGRVSEYLAADVICVGGDNSFSTVTAEALEDAVFNDGKILMVNFWSDEQFNEGLPATKQSYAGYGPQVLAEARTNPIVSQIMQGLPDVFDSDCSFNRRLVATKEGATIVTRFADDNSPALVVWQFGKGAVIYQPLELNGCYYKENTDRLVYQALKWAMLRNISKVVGVLVKGSTWSGSFLNAVDPGYGQGYPIPVGSSAQLAPLPWVNIDQIKIAFSEDVVVQETDLALQGVKVAEYAFSGFSYEPTTFTATWTLSAPVGADKLLIDLADAVHDLSNNALDGEWTDASSMYPSGDGNPGGNFLFRFNVLPGDVDENATVNILDTVQTRNKQFKAVGDPNYSLFHDVDGSGGINILDTVGVRNRQFTTLPAGEPSATQGK